MSRCFSWLLPTLLLIVADADAGEIRGWSRQWSAGNAVRGQGYTINVAPGGALQRSTGWARSATLAPNSPANATWYSVGSGYSYGPQTGLPWRGELRSGLRRGEDLGNLDGLARSARISRRDYVVRNVNAPASIHPSNRTGHTPDLLPAGSKDTAKPATTEATRPDPLPPSLKTTKP